LTSRWENGFVHAQPNVFGTIHGYGGYHSPGDQPRNISQGRDMSSSRMISFTITDDLSGIKSYGGFIDNEWVLFEFDPKNNHLFYIFDEKRIGRGKNRQLELYVMDNKDNLSVYSVGFYY
jgi:hypothetical protein